MEALKGIIPADNQQITLLIYAGVFILIFAGMCLLSIFLHKCFEMPLNKYLKRVLIKPAPKKI
jgi:peptidoglycan/LPS O-acetylase OafA/YrhL